MSASPQDVRQFTVDLPDGRSLAACEVGDPDGAVVIYHHGTPMSRLLMQEWAVDASNRGIRLIGFDRAGYGDSSRKAGRIVADVTADVTALADALGAQRFYVWGLSGGGPHALACAALLGDRVIAAASVASVAPYTASDLDFLDGMGQDNIDEFGAAAQGESALRPYLDKQTAGLLAATPEELGEEMATLLPPVDLDVLTGDTAVFMHTAMANGLRASVDGWLDDDLAFVENWGFDLASISVPLVILQGDQDLMVPFAHGKWLAGAVPGATVRLLPGEGHLSLAAKIGEVHAWLLEHA